jgi:hypothetical protein
MQMSLLWPDASAPVPDFQSTLTALGPIPSIFYRAVEFGTLQNRSFFDLLSEKEMPRPHIREMIVRDQAKRFLERNNFQVEEDRLIIGNEPLVALVVRCGPVRIRAVKGRKGVLPGCGRSRERRRFYGQQPSFYLDRSSRMRRTRLNLVLLYDFDELFNLARLWLACPRSGGARSSDVTSFWNEPIPYPVSSSSQTSAATQDSVDADLDRLLRDENEDEQDSAEEA